MVERIITEGSKVELQRLASVAQNRREGTDKEVKTYYSLVSEVLDEDRIKITMPLEKGRVVSLSVNSRYNACFYTPHGLYQGRIIVVDRYKEGNIFMLVVELTSDLIKFQRRQYYRLGCTMDIVYKKIEKDAEIEFTRESMPDANEDGDEVSREDYIEGVALDISGGGMRFTSEQKLAEGDDIFVVIQIQYKDDKKIYGLNARVIYSQPLTNHAGKYEHRVEYKNINGKVREDLIKYIFDEERRQRKKESEI